MSPAERSPAPFDLARVRADFPVLATTMRGKPLAYLDTAASAQKPRAVIDALADFYSRHYANIHRGVYELSERATAMHEEARAKVQRFLGAAAPREVVFTRNATEAVNLVASAWGRGALGEGDEILLTEMEHHANIVPWQMLCEETGARIRVLPVDDEGALRLEELDGLLSERTKLVAVTHVSNALGTVNPVAEITRRAHAAGARVLVDGAQAVPRFPVDVRAIGCEFYVFSGHKLYGPSGIGALYARGDVLEAMPPYQGGGEMIESVTFEKTTYKPAPYRFEAGTPDIAGAVALGAAIDYVRGIGLEKVAEHEAALTAYGTELLAAIPELRLIGTAKEKTGVLSFVIEGVHPHDVGTVLDQHGVAIRAGHHCAQPLMQRFGVPATVRASLGLYNEPAELDRLAEGLREAIQLFR